MARTLSIKFDPDQIEVKEMTDIDELQIQKLTIRYNRLFLRYRLLLCVLALLCVMFAGITRLLPNMRERERQQSAQIQELTKEVQSLRQVQKMLRRERESQQMKTMQAEQEEKKAHDREEARRLQQ